MKYMNKGGYSPTQYIKSLLLEGKNSIQIYTLVQDRYPEYDEKNLRNLISVLKSQYIKKRGMNV